MPVDKRFDELASIAMDGEIRALTLTNESKDDHEKKVFLGIAGAFNKVAEGIYRIGIKELSDDDGSDAD